MTHNYYNKPEYEGYETDYRILDAIEEITKSNITDHESGAYSWWVNGGDEEKIITYLDDNHTDWRENKHLNWGDGILKNDKICDVCDEPLILDDGYWSCPVYMEGKEENSDEHTSKQINEEK